MGVEKSDLTDRANASSSSNAIRGRAIELVLGAEGEGGAGGGGVSGLFGETVGGKEEACALHNTHAHTQTLVHTRTHTQTLVHTLRFSLSHRHTCTRVQTHTRTHTLFFLTHTHKCT